MAENYASEFEKFHGYRPNTISVEVIDSSAEFFAAAKKFSQNYVSLKVRFCLDGNYEIDRKMEELRKEERLRHMSSNFLYNKSFKYVPAYGLHRTHQSSAT